MPNAITAALLGGLADNCSRLHQAVWMLKGGAVKDPCRDCEHNAVIRCRANEPIQCPEIGDAVDDLVDLLTVATQEKSFILNPYEKEIKDERD